MASTPVPITVDGHTYTVPGADTIEPLAVSVAFNGSGAAGDFLPCLSYYTQAGQLISRTFPASSVAAGSSAEVSFIPFVPPASGAASGSGSYVFLDEQTPNVSNNTIVFAAIPQTYRHLVVDLSLCRSASNLPTVVMYWNNASTWYSDFVFFKSPAGALSRCDERNDGDGVYLNFGFVNGAGAQSRPYNLPVTGDSQFADYVVQFPWYSRSDRTHRCMWQGSIEENSGTTYTTGSGGEHLNDPPVGITDLFIGTGTGTLGAGSIATLYGIL